MTPYISRPNTVPQTYCNAVDAQRANATFVMLARNSDADGAVHAVRSMEDRFNRNYKYPWVFLNEEPFSDDFKRYTRPSSPPSLHKLSRMLTPVPTPLSHISRVSIVASGPVYFGQIPEGHWYQPSWINETRAKEERDKMQAENIMYGGSLSCDFPLSMCCA